MALRWKSDGDFCLIIKKKKKKKTGVFVFYFFLNHNWFFFFLIEIVYAIDMLKCGHVNTLDRSRIHLSYESWLTIFESLKVLTFFQFSGSIFMEETTILSTPIARAYSGVPQLFPSLAAILLYVVRLPLFPTSSTFSKK